MSKPQKLSITASGAATWSRCTAQPHYVLANAKHIPPQSTSFSVEGVVAHKVVEYLFKSTPFKVGDTVYERGKPVGKIDGEMVKHATNFVQYCSQFESDWSYSELNIKLFYNQIGNGFIDWCSFAPDVIDVADFKYGQGVSVSAKENLQMSIYARSAIKQKKIPVRPDTKVRLHIHQPRVRQGERLSMWEITYAELEQFTDDRVQGPANVILNRTDDLTFDPSDKTCQFCPAKTFCGLKGYEPPFAYQGEMRAQWATKGTPLTALTKGETPVLKPVSETPDDVIVRILAQKDEIVSWLNTFEKYGLQMAAAGTALPGTKIVASKGGHRAWSDPDEAKIMFLDLVEKGKVTKEQIITEKLLTPKQAEEFEFDFEKEQWKEVQALIFKPKGKPVLAPLDDPRPAYSGEADISGLFDEEEEI
jgi:hypothetical protein